MSLTPGGHSASNLLLVHPPLTRACEPPAGVARLAGHLRSAGVRVDVWDANLAGQLFLLSHSPDAEDTWTHRAGRDLPGHLVAVRDGRAFAHPDTYRRIIRDLERLLAKHPAAARGWRLSLTEVGHERLHATASADLLEAAAHPEDDPFFPLFAPALEHRLSATGATWLGLSVIYLGQALTAFAMAGFVRRRAPGVKIVLGGGLVTSWCSRPGFVSPFGGLIDRLLPGPGEESLLRAMAPPHSPASGARSLLSLDSSHVDSGQPEACTQDPADPYGMRTGNGLGWAEAGVPGVQGESDRTAAGGVRGGGPSGPSGTGDRKTSVAGPAWDFTDFPLADYLSPGLILPVNLASGCFWARCAFCPETAEGNPYRPDAGDPVRGLEKLAGQWSPRLFHLIDNAVSPAMLRALADHPPGVPWYGFVRFGPPLDDPDFCVRLRRSGCVMLQLGLESGDQAVLDAMQKGLDLTVASRILANLKAAGVRSFVYLLFGTPAENASSAGRTLAFTAAHAATIDFLNLAIFNLPVGATEVDGLETRPYSADDLSLYLDFRHPAGWDRKQVRAFLDREFKRHPAIAPIIRRDPPAFTSNHAPFLLPR